MLDRALHSINLVDINAVAKTDWLADMRAAYNADDGSGNYHFAEWTLLTYGNLHGLENLLQSGKQSYMPPDWGAAGQLPSHGLFFGEDAQPLLHHTFCAPHYYGAMLLQYYSDEWRGIVPGYDQTFFRNFDIRFAGLLPWDAMVAASFKIAMIQEAASRGGNSREPFPDQWRMDNVDWLVHPMLDTIPQNQDIFDFLASDWADIIREDDLLYLTCLLETILTVTLLFETLQPLRPTILICCVGSLFVCTVWPFQNRQGPKFKYPTNSCVSFLIELCNIYQ